MEKQQEHCVTIEITYKFIAYVYIEGAASDEEAEKEADLQMDPEFRLNEALHNGLEPESVTIIETTSTERF